LFVGLGGFTFFGHDTIFSVPNCFSKYEESNKVFQ